MPFLKFGGTIAAHYFVPFPIDYSFMSDELEIYLLLSIFLIIPEQLLEEIILRWDYYRILLTYDRQHFCLDVCNDYLQGLP